MKIRRLVTAFLTLLLVLSSLSFACPSALGNKKGNAEYFASLLNRTARDFRVIYTRSEKGRQELLKCRRMSITSGTKPVKNKRVLL